MSMATGADQDPAEGGLPYGARLHQMAEPRREEVAVVFVAEDGHERLVTWGEVDDRSTQVARVLAEEGLAAGDSLAIALKNSPEHLFTCFAGWKVGATVVPMRTAFPLREARTRRSTALQ